MMGLFNLNRKKDSEPAKQPVTPDNIWKDSVNKLNNDEITLQEFININADIPLYYSTPLGENTDGEMIFWLISNTQLDMEFYPTFLSAELCHNTFSSAGRKNFTIIEGTLESALSMLDSNPVLQELGLMIQDENGSLPLPPKIRVQR